MGKFVNKKKEVEAILSEKDGLAIPMNFIGCISLLDAVIHMVKDLPSVPADMREMLEGIQKSYLVGCIDNASTTAALHLAMEAMFDNQLLGFSPRVRETKETMEMVDNICKGLRGVIDLESAEAIDSKDIPKQFH